MENGISWNMKVRSWVHLSQGKSFRAHMAHGVHVDSSGAEHFYCDRYLTGQLQPRGPKKSVIFPGS